jgi:hypothetical protein
MSDAAPERIVVTYNLTAHEYAGYAAAVERSSRSWTAFNISVAMVFCAIPVALLFRSLAAQSLDDPGAIEMAGHFSLYSFGLGVIACWIGAALLGWFARRRYFKTIANSPEPRTAELDHTGVTVSSKGARAAYEWTVVRRCTFERSLLLIWIAPSTALAIPSRSFGSEAACAAALAFVRARLSDARTRTAQPNAGNAPTSAA